MLDPRWGLTALSVAVIIAFVVAASRSFDPFRAINKMTKEDKLSKRDQMLLNRPIDFDEKESNGVFDSLQQKLSPNETKLRRTLGASKLLKIRNLIVQSSNPLDLHTVADYYGIALIMMGIGAIVGFIVGLFFSVPYITTPLFAVMGYFIPLFIMHSGRDENSTKIVQVLPESLDLLNVIMGAGSTFINAFSEMAKSSPDSLLRPEFRKTASQMDSGVSVDEAFQDLESQFRSEELSTFAKTIRRANQTGADMTNTLDQNSKLIRSSYESHVNKRIDKMESTLQMQFMGFGLVSFVLSVAALPLVSSMSSLSGMM